jgi:hypothetical protein
VDQILVQCAAWERGEGEDLGFGLVHERPELGESFDELVAPVSQVAATAPASVWAKIVRNSAATRCCRPLGTWTSRFRAAGRPLAISRANDSTWFRHTCALSALVRTEPVGSRWAPEAAKRFSLALRWIPSVAVDLDERHPVACPPNADDDVRRVIYPFTDSVFLLVSLVLA